MNAAVIIKIEYKALEGGEYTTIDFVPHSGFFSENIEDTRAGKLFSAKSEFKIAKIEPETDGKLKNLAGKGNTFKLTDSNNIVHILGDNIYRAYFSFEKNTNGSPSSFNGYSCSIARSAPTSAPISIAE